MFQVIAVRIDDGEMDISPVGYCKTRSDAISVMVMNILTDTNYRTRAQIEGDFCLYEDGVIAAQTRYGSMQYWKIIEIPEKI